MTDEYLAFVLAYDYPDVLSYIDLPCDEMFELCMKIVQYARKQTNEELYYDTFCMFVEDKVFMNSHETTAKHLVHLGLLDKSWKNPCKRGQ